MRLRLLGTGSAAGWPNPWCACASCAAAVRQGVLRGQTSVLVDDRLLLDVGAEAPRAAVRAGVGLAGVEAVLVGHGHPDHHDPAAWRWRAWAGARTPLHVVAPPAVVDAAQPWLGPSVTVSTVRAGDALDVAGYAVRVLPAAHGRPDLGPAVLYDLTAPDGARLLYGCDTGPLPRAALDATLGRAYDVVLLELTGALDTHLDLRTWPEQVAALRRLGAVTPRTRLLAVHLGHELPPPDELDALLASWGASAPRDGDVLEVGPASAPAAAPPSRVLVLGGARSGKSAHAEAVLAAEPAVTYVATAPPRPGDAEWDDRVAAHVVRRPAHWTTVETGDVAGALRDAEGAVLVDDLGLWLTRLLDDAAAWDDRAAAGAAVDAALPGLTDAWRGSRRAVVVAPEVGGGLVAATLGGRLFVDLLGQVTAALARDADEVVQVVAGLPRRLR